MSKILPVLTLMLAHAVPAQAAPPLETAPARLTQCRPGPSEPSSFPELRPGRTATCPYDAANLEQRIGSLIERATDRRAEAVLLALAFGLPAMTTSYDSTRQADYGMTVTGEDGWKIRLHLRESAFPLDEKLPPAFEPGLIPRRLREIDELDLDIRITIFPKEGASGPDGCITAARLAAFASAGGWKDRTALSPMNVTDAGPGYPFFTAADGRTLSFWLDRQAGQVPSEQEMRNACVTSVTIRMPPKGTKTESWLR